MNPIKIVKPEDHRLTNDHAQPGTLCVAHPSKLRRLAASALLCLTALVSAGVQAQMVTVTPAEYTNGLANPLMGFRDGFEGIQPFPWGDNPYQTVVRHYIPWKDIENLQTDGVQKIKDYCNQAWAGCETANVKIIPRVVLHLTENGSDAYYFPSYLTSEDWTSQATRTAVTNMIRKLGEAWNNDPRVAWVQTGIIGKWGEQETPVDVDDPVVAPNNATWAEIMGKAFTNAFPNKMILARNNESWNDSQELGVYWDSFANWTKMNGATDPYNQILIRNASPYNRYLVSPIEGEVAYGSFQPTHNPGNSPNQTVGIAANYNWLIDVIRATHCSALGWVASYTYTQSSNTLGASLIQKAFGYRFRLNEFQCSQRADQGGTLNLNFKVINTGSAPMYENWPVAFVLINQSTRQIAWKTTLSGTDITTWRPGSNYDWTPTGLYQSTGSRTYLTPAATNQISDSVTVPSSLPTGEYLAGIAILDPTTQLPGVFFAVKNFFKESQTQPLVRIGIGVNASSHTLSGVAFDDPVANDARYYLTNQVGATVSVSATDSSAGEPSNNGTFTFTRSGSTSAALTVNFTVGGTATSGSDYQSLGASVTFLVGQSNATKTVTVINDTTPESTETAIVTLATGTGYTMGSPSSATVNIADDGDTSPSGGNVGALTGWVSGNTNAKQPGNNRLMTVMVMGEHSGAFSATSVTYGGQTMTKRTERLHGSSTRTYAALFTLGEAGVNAANAAGAIVVNWSSIPSGGSSTYSVLLTNVDQTASVSASASNGLDGTSISTAALATGSGDMVIVCGATANNNAITFNNGFTEQFESDSSWGDGTGGSKAGSGASETPSFSQSATGRMVICAIVVKKAGGVPLPWISTDVGAVSSAGSASSADGGSSWTVAGSGAGIAGTADEFRLVYQAGNSNCTMVAKVLTLDNTDPNAKAGVFIRETTNANAQAVSLCMTRANGVVMQWRTLTGGATSSQSAALAFQPVSLRLERTGDSFTGSYSTNNGANWLPVGGAQTVGMTPSGNVVMGIGVTSHSDGTLCTTTMSNVTATP